MTYWYIAILIYLSTQTHSPQKWHEYLWISICIEYMVYIYPNVYVLSVIFLANQPAIVSRYLSTCRSTCRLIEWTRGCHQQSVLSIWECMITNFVKFMKKTGFENVSFCNGYLHLCSHIYDVSKTTGWRKGPRDDWQSNMRYTGRESEGGIWAGSLFLLP